MTVPKKSTKTSKFIREYGMTLHQLAHKYEMTTSYLYILHQRGELHAFIKDTEKKKEESGKSEKMHV